MESTASKKERVIAQAPVFVPTEEEFANPLEFIRKVKEQAEPYGIVKIITPEKWRPTSLPTARKSFSSYRQSIHELRRGHMFGSGDNYSMSTYKEYADNLERKWRLEITSNLDQSFQNKSSSAEEEAQQWSKEIQEYYWSMVEGTSKRKAIVDYASNLPVQTEFENGSWNFRSLICLEENIVNKTGAQVPGVTSPWLYLGCLFSTFCWHVEDQFLYSMNYLHSGANKVWYGIPSSSALAFEGYVSSSCSTRSMKTSLLQDMTQMISPFEFPENISLYTTVQKPGDLIVTFPEAFHGGYNEGWNLAEAVNFGLLNWLPFGMRSINRYQKLKDPIFSMDKLLWTLVQQALEDTKEGGKTIQPDLKNAFIEACNVELKSRECVMNKLYRVKRVIPHSKYVGEPIICRSCKCFNFFAFVFCRCMIEDEQVLCLNCCLENIAFACGCRALLCTEISDDEIKTMIEKVEQMEQISLDRTF